MKRKVYIETSIVSYLAARPSSDPVVRMRQLLTQEWWANRGDGRFDLFVSALVLEEARKGDPDAAARRLKELANIPGVEATVDALELAALLVSQRIVPANAGDDALHIAIAAYQGMDFLLTWNCRQIANAEVTWKLRKVCSERGLLLPVLCTPEQLMTH
jgi:hypothetical protein